MVSLDPEISILLKLSISSEVSSGARNGPTSANVPKEKMENLVSQQRSKSRISNLLIFSNLGKIVMVVIGMVNKKTRS